MTIDSCNAIRSFLEDVQKSPNTIRIGESQIISMLDSMSTCLESSCNYIKTTPTNTNYKTELEGYGVVLSSLINKYINRPSNIRHVGDEIWISNLESEIVRFDKNFSYLGGLRGLAYGDPAQANQFRNCTDFSVIYNNVTQTVERVIMVSSDHIAKVYETDANGFFQLLYTIGTDTISGNAPLLNNCTGCEFLPNGDFIIVNKNGETNNSGSVVQYAQATGNPIKTQLQDTGTNLGSVWDDECTNPTSVKVLDNKIYISTERDEIGVWDITDTFNWVYETVYTKPDGVNSNTMNPYGICINITEDVICTCSNTSSEVVTMGIIDHDLKNITGIQKFDDVSAPNDYINEFGSTNAVEFFYNDLDEIIGRIVIDTTNNRVQVIPGKDTIDIPYTFVLPDGKEVIETSNCVGNFDIITSTLTININDIDKVKDFYVIIDNIKNCPV